MGTMFGAPGGDYCHGLLHSDQIGPNRPGPKGYVDQPIPIDGLYLASAGCHGGPGITFIPGYNAAHQALADSTAERCRSCSRLALRVHHLHCRRRQRRCKFRRG